MIVDAIVVGQGISGTFLQYFAAKAGKKVLVIDEDKYPTSSKIASGVINPITGRRLVRTWMIEDVLPFAVKAYKSFEENFNCSILSNKNIIQFFTTQQMQQAFEQKLSTEKEYLLPNKEEAFWQQYFITHYGIGEINQCWHIDINTMLAVAKKHLQQQQLLLNETFDNTALQILNDKVVYKDITAEKIFFCDGVHSMQLPYFKHLPFAPNKGEMIIIEAKDLPATNMYKQALSLLPWKPNLFWVGSTYNWQFTHTNITAEFLQKVNTSLNSWLKVPYKIVEHTAAVRPANTERRPFVGFHTQYKNIGILNGMGTKGCSLAPYFAQQLVQHWLHGTAINTAADVKRFG